ncbi:MAG: VTT domain-containing protein [Anaerolineaceae bacterium]|nr:VTT domain-containing protein [Anaerolineaceae bacterium]
MNQNRWGVVLRVGIILAIIALSVYLYSIRGRVRELQGYGYPGIFLFNLLASATLILPVPGVLVTSLMGGMFNPFWVAVAAGSGASIGELSGYLAGFSGQKVAKRTPMYERMEGWMKKYGNWAILLLAFVPNPFFDMAGMIAGALRMSVWRFWIWCLLGKILKMLLFAYGGASIVRLIPFR